MSVFDPQLERAYYRYQAGAYGRSWDHKVSRATVCYFESSGSGKRLIKTCVLLLCVSLVTQNGRNCVPKWGATANKDNQDVVSCVNV